ncbi:MAG TPA: diacylglycerol kinase family protein [Candidatus Heimdallarchaeota archaeon]|nr:diacylglycerol kinase family protein [Candidatus Heimdallarchaeota archaeon]
MIILLNKYCNGTGGLEKWKKLKADLEENYLGKDYTIISGFKKFQATCVQEFDRGERLFVAAGGDGTVNFILNQLMALENGLRKELILGAIGLGSSNDFHKSFTKNGNGQSKGNGNNLPNSNGNGQSNGNGKVPVKLNYKQAKLHNVGLVDYEDLDHNRRRKYFIVNCSVGLVAQANYFFNSENRIVNWLKPKWVEGTIWYAALETLFTAKNIPTEIRVEDERVKTELTTFSAFINPNVSGNFRYDFEISAQSDYLGVALCESMGIPARVRTMFSMTQGKFVGLPKTRIWRAREIEISPSKPIALEMDGEVSLARFIRIKLLRNALRVCQ